MGWANELLLGRRGGLAFFGLLPGVLDEGRQGDVAVRVGEFHDGGIDFIPGKLSQRGLAEVCAFWDENRVFRGGGVW
ncbi:MAG: hypothetical protein JWL81_2065 [Verrucomicrobiales bacterium]|nr:hypothetical protein [Verrucomicrobiales bacterium]